MIRFLVFLSVIIALRLLLFYFFQPKEQSINRNAIRETTIFTQVKEHVKDTYYKNLNVTQAGLLSGIVFGDKDLNRQENELFKKTGLLHVVAASGMNVSMLTSFLLATAVMFFSRRNAIALTILAVIFYTALADFQPSIVRAGIMGVLALSAGLLGRQNTSILALIIAASGMILFDPSIVTSISFILSFSATLGIILFDPLLKMLFERPYLEDFRTTISAQIATTPIILFFFGTYSIISIPANLLVLWTVPPLMALGFIGAVLSFVAPVFSMVFIVLCMPLLAYFLAVTEFLSKFELELHLKSLPWALILGYYLILLSLIIRLYKIKKVKV